MFLYALSSDRKLKNVNCNLTHKFDNPSIRGKDGSFAFIFL